MLPAGGAVLDLGCGQAVLAALLVAAGKAPRRYTGIELMQRDVDRAMHVARATPDCEMKFVTGDIRTTPFPAADAVVILDVLHYVDHDAQAEVLKRVRDALSGGGVLLLRVGDEAPTFRFRYTVAIDRLVMALRGHRLERLYCKPVARWRAELEALGFSVEPAPMSAGTPFANVLLVARYDGHR
jgi:SAM-dependent methyltransferase